MTKDSYCHPKHGVHFYLAVLLAEPCTVSNLLDYKVKGNNLRQKPTTIEAKFQNTQYTLCTQKWETLLSIIAGVLT